MKKLIVLFAATLFLNTLPVYAVNYSGEVKVGQRNYNLLKKAACVGISGCGLATVRVLGNWAWVVWGTNDISGSSVLHYTGSNWTVILCGGGALNISDAIGNGVPQSVAEKLVPVRGTLSPLDYRLTTDDLEYLSEWELMVARNSIFARHGRIFNYKPLKDYFSTWPWYRPNSKFHEGMLTETEKYNANLILQVEQEKGYM